MMRSIFWIFLCSTCLAFLSGCGFHLRGNIAIPDWAQLMYVQSNTPYGRFELLLKRALKTSGATLVQEEKAAVVTVQILNQQTDRKILTLGSDARVQDFQLTYTVTLQMLDNTQTVFLTPITLTQNRHYTFNKKEVLGKSEEETLLLSDMQKELAYQAIQVMRAALVNTKYPHDQHSE